MLDVALLGTGGTMPLPDRFLTSLLLRYEGGLTLIDCGEGTQVSLKLLGFGFKQIGTICFTHFHADHISGLPGMLLAIANAGRVEPLVIIGPKGVKNVVDSLRVIAPELPFEIEFYEIGVDGTQFYFSQMKISTIALEHRVPCYGYKIEIMRAGKFNAERAKFLELPVNCWGILQKGESILYNGKKYTPDMVLGAPRKGLKVCYNTDMRPSNKLVEFVRGADLFVSEGVYGDKEKADKARAYKHTLMSESCIMAREAEVSELWLTHFSPSMVDPSIYKKEVREIFPNTKIGKDRMWKNLMFSKE